MARCLGRIILAGVLLGGSLAVFGQSPQPLPDAPTPQPQQPSQNMPDAPSASRPTVPLPSTLPTAPPPGQPSSSNPPPPEPKVVTVPPGQAPNVPGSARDQLGYTITHNVNFVVVPVSVKDSSGHLVQGLLKNDFSVYEDGNREPISFFTSDPFPLSAAVVLDGSLAESEFRKVADTLSALGGAFSQFDEVGLYIYGNTVKRLQSFTAVNDSFYEALRQIKKDQRGRTGGPPIVGGPLGQTGPTINGRPADPSQPSIVIPGPTREFHVLNDAILAAAIDLEKRDATRRKIIFVISDGREQGSDASYSEVLRVLLSDQIQVYGLGVGGAAIPGYGKLQEIPFPGRGTGDILPKYASATGGQMFKEYSQSAIEQAYARITEEARNQYTLGYSTRATPSSSYRSIEVRVDQPGLKVYAKDGYYPLPVVR